MRGKSRKEDKKKAEKLEKIEHNWQCVIHVVKSGNKDETTNFTENPWKGSMKCTFLKELSYYQKFAECYIGVQLLHQI